MLKKFFFVSFLFLLVACSQDAPVTQSSQPQQAAPATAAAPADVQADGDPLLIFFLDPNGGPCRTQNTILEKMAEEFKGKVSLRYVQTTIKDDLQFFYAYGVRGLPLLMLTDVNGKEIKRMTPGVKQAASIREFLRSLPN